MKPAASVRTLTLLLAVCATLASPVHGQDPCPSASGVDAEAGWAAYVDNEMVEARRRFESALIRCDNDQYARTGLAYVDLREGDPGEAERLLLMVIDVEPNNIDALVGLGLVEWRSADLEAVGEYFGLVVELDPENVTALDYLARIEGQVLGPPPERPDLVRPDALQYPARTNGDRFEIRTDRGWTPFYIKGVNLGAALPGKHPSEFPDSATYARWIRRMADMNANTVRVYTIHPPAFYDALYDWNTQNPDRLLWLIHGVWTELPKDHDYRDAAYEREFFGEMHRVVDLLHGRADIARRPGHAAGFYTSDVSPWTLAYIIGREWEPFSAIAYDSIRGGESGFEGLYLRVNGGNAMDAWMGRASEEIIAYETETYRAQRPIAYTNWPTLDPLTHPTEPTVDEEMAIRRARGETPDVRIKEYDNDGLSLDAARVTATERLPAGYFASYHAYPYYPDFMILQDDYQTSSSTMGRSNYFGYLMALKAHHPNMPVVISEYGVPASLGSGHLQPQGWHHGGLTEAQMSDIDRRMTLELAEAGMAGGALFAWIDEWFKKNWVVLEFELPAERNRLWYNRLDAEQHYGLWAMEAKPPLEGATLEERLPAWRELSPLYVEGPLEVRAASDAAYLWLLIDAPGVTALDTVLVGFDVIHPGEGGFAWPGRPDDLMPVGVEFVLQATGGEVRVMADPASNPFRLVEVGQGASGLEGREVAIENPLPGFFYGRVEQRFNLPYYTRANYDGVYDSLRVVVNRRRFTRDSTEYLGIGYDRGLLPGGAGPDGLWEEAGGVLEVRIPWLLLNVTDPSSRTVLQGPGRANAGDAELGPDGRWRLKPGIVAWPDTVSGAFGTEQIEGIGIVVAVRGGDRISMSAPAAGAAVAQFSWQTWETPEWVERPRAVYRTMSELYGLLDPYSGSPAIQPRRDDSEGQRDEANDAWTSGDTDLAYELYGQRLELNPNDGAALHRMALMRAWREDYDGALELFDVLHAVEPRNVDARIDRARVQAWAGDNAEALAALDVVIEEYPEHPGALEARALFQAWAGLYEESLSSYEQLLSISPDNGVARRRRAQVMGWASDIEGSRNAYEEILARDPDDVDARIGLATTLAFADDLDASIAEYDRILARDPGNLRALQGKGRVLGWGDRLIEAEELLRDAVALDPSDATTLAGLGQILQWQGRNAAAKDVLEQAVRASPTNGDARQQLRVVNLALAPVVRPTTVYASDSDGNRMLTTSMGLGFHPMARLDLRLDGYRRRLEQGALERTALGGTVTAAYQFTPGWTLTGVAGASRTNGTGDPSFPILSGRLRSPDRHRVGLSLDAGTGGLDETAALAERGVKYTNLAASLRLTPGSGWRIDGGIARYLFDGSEDNARNSASFSVAKRIGSSFSIGTSFRAFKYEKNLNDGYFDPDFYGIAELTSYWRHRPLPWAFLVEVAPGVQQVTTDGDPTFSFRGSGRLAYLLAPGTELSLSVAFSSAGLLSLSTGAAESGYQYTAVIFGLSWVL